MSFLWDWIQQSQIKSNSQTANDAQIGAHQNARDIDQLEDKVNALSLACRALWEILSEKHGVTDQQLADKIEEIDLRDGKLDGKFSGNITHCPDCGHKLNKRHRTCFYCGARIEGGGLFP